MKVLKYELKKLLKFPLMWGLLALFIGFNVYIICCEVGNKEYQQSLRGVYEVMMGRKTSGENYRLYTQYRKEVSAFYDSLDMQSIKQMKEDMGDFHPAGSYERFIDNNYSKLQKRVEQIKSDGDTDGNFYPGDIFNVHRKLYLVIKLCIIEMIIMMCFSVLYLMDFERLNRTEDLVFSSRIGRIDMKIKHRAGISGGLAFSVLILSVSLGVFLALVPMNGLWKTPVSSVMVMESSGLWMYPFITFVRLTIGQEFALAIMTIVLLILLFGFIAGAVQLFVNNSYITMISTAACFVGLMVLPTAVKSAGWLKTIVSLNPVSIWFYCGRLFIENDLHVAFAWSEFVTLGIFSVISIIFMLLSKRFFMSKDI